MVHGPLNASPEFRGKSGKGLYGDAVAEVDWSVGRILDKLRKLGIDRNTLVLFTSDNGGGGRGRDSSNAPYSGGKATPAEGGFRVPTIAWWPGTIPGGTACDLMASTVDLLPTFAALSGSAHQASAKRPIDGLDLSNLFQGPLPGTSPRDSFVYYNLGRLSAVRQGKWKLYRQPARFSAAGRGAQLVVPNGALFDLEKDPAESSNVAAQHPDVVQRLKHFADQIAAKLGERAGEGTEVRAAGFVDQAKPLNASAVRKTSAANTDKTLCGRVRTSPCASSSTRA